MATVRKQFLATGDARRAQSVVASEITGYREWLWNTLYALGYTPLDLTVQTGWSGWGDMEVYFDLDVICGDDVPRIRQNIASILQHGDLLHNATVSTLGSDPNTTNCGGGGGGSTNTGGGSANNGTFNIYSQGNSPVMNYDPTTGQSTYQPGGGGNPPADKFDFEKFVKEYGLYLMGGTLMLLLIARR